MQEDFELICFDLVHSPSTPGAYLFSKKEDRKLYDEKLEEEIVEAAPGIDLMKKLTHYLGR